MNEANTGACSLVTRETAQRVLEVVDQGLSRGLGQPVPGQMCVEAAVCYAMGLPHSDQPACVAPAVRSYKIRLNDADWSSKEARAKGMRRVAVAQLGSDHIDNRAFAAEVTIQVTKQLLPMALRAAAKRRPAYAPALETAASLCETVTDLAGARAAAKQARDAAYAYAAAAYAAADAAYAAAAYADAAYAAADAAAYAAAYAAAAAYADAKTARDSVLTKAAEIGVQALIKLGAKGVEWLDLCD